MKINIISTYVLVCLLRFSKWNLIAPVRAAGEDGSSTTTPPTSGDDGSTVNPGQGATVIPPADTANKTSFELDIKKSDGTDEFDYKKDGKIATFTAKDNYAFSVVNQNNTEIWKANDQSEYATKVVLDGKGKKDKKVTIHLPNNITKVFKRDKNNPWSEVTQESNQTTGQSRGSGGLTSGGSLATVDIKKPHAEGYKSTADCYILTYTPRGDYSFNAVKEDSKEIWKTEKSDEYSKKVMADFAKNVVTIYIGSGEGSTKVFTKGSDSNWKEDTNASTHKTKTDTSGTTGPGGGTTPSSQPTAGGGTGTGGE